MEQASIHTSFRGLVGIFWETCAGIFFRGSPEFFCAHAGIFGWVTVHPAFYDFVGERGEQWRIVNSHRNEAKQVRG